MQEYIIITLVILLFVIAVVAIIFYSTAKGKVAPLKTMLEEERRTNSFLQERHDSLVKASEDIAERLMLEESNNEELINKFEACEEFENSLNKTISSFKNEITRLNRILDRDAVKSRLQIQQYQQALRANSIAN